MDQKRLYETTFIVNGSLDDAQTEAVIAKVQEIITKNGGEVVSLIRWGRKRLAYPIHHKNNGFYVNCEFNAYPQFIQEFKRFYFLEENIIRYLLIVVTKNMLKAKVVKPFVLEPIVVASETAIEEIIIKEELENAKEEIETPLTHELHKQQDSKKEE